MIYALVDCKSWKINFNFKNTMILAPITKMHTIRKYSIDTCKYNNVKTLTQGRNSSDSTSKLYKKINSNSLSLIIILILIDSKLDNLSIFKYTSSNLEIFLIIPYFYKTKMSMKWVS